MNASVFVWGLCRISINQRQEPTSLNLHKQLKRPFFLIYKKYYRNLPNPCNPKSVKPTTGKSNDSCVKTIKLKPAGKAYNSCITQNKSNWCTLICSMYYKRSIK
jgi:hypothetical protein